MSKNTLSKELQKVINKTINGIKLDLNTENAFKKANVIIDFTIPKCTLSIINTYMKKRN